MTRSWIDDLFDEAIAKNWCTRTYCTTCGCTEFRGGYIRCAAQEISCVVEGGARTHPRDLLEQIPAEKHPAVFEAIVDALAHSCQSPPSSKRSEALRTLLADLDPPLLRWGVFVNLAERLAGTPAGANLADKHADEEWFAEEETRRAAYESPEAVQARREEQRKERATRHATRLEGKAKRDDARQQFLTELAAMSGYERLLRVAKEEPGFPLEIIPPNLVRQSVPTVEPL